MSVELGCRRDVNAPEFIIVGVPNVTAGAGGGGGPSKPTEMPPPMSIPVPMFIPIFMLPVLFIGVCFDKVDRIPQ
jgi:hypothetical protein